MLTDKLRLDITSYFLLQVIFIFTNEYDVNQQTHDGIMFNN